MHFAVSTATRRSATIWSSTARRVSGLSNAAGSTWPRNMRRTFSCCARNCSSNSRREMSEPLTLATVSPPPT